MSDQPPSPTPPKPKKRLIRRLFRWAFRLALLAVVLLVLLAVGVKLYFTPARTGQVVSRVAKSVLKQDVSIATIAIHPFSGIEVTQVVIPDPTRPDRPPIFKLGRFTLDYSLKPLWNRLLKINKIQIVDPELNVVSEGGKWNFLALLPPKSPAPPPPPKKPGPAKPLSLPVGFELTEFSVQNLRITAAQEQQLTATIKDFKLFVAARVNQVMTDAVTSVSLQIPEVAVESPKFGALKTDVSAELSVKADVSTGDVSRLAVKARMGNLVHEELNGTVGGFGKKDIDLTNTVKVHLDALRPMMSQELAKKLEGVKFSGDVDVTTRVQGKLSDANSTTHAVPDLRVEGNVLVKVPDAGYAKMSAVVKDFLADLSYNVDYALKGGLGQSSIAGTVKLAKVAAMNKAVVNDTTVDMKVQTSSRALKDALLGVVVKVPEVIVTDPKIGTVKTSLSAEVNAHADVPAGDIDGLSVKVAVGDLLRNSITGSVQGFGKKGVVVSNLADVNLDAVPAFLTPELKAKIGDVTISGKTQVKTDVSGRLPEAGKRTENAAAPDLHVNAKILTLIHKAGYGKLKASAADVTTDINISAGYSLSQGASNVTVAGNVALSQAAGLDKASFGDTSVDLDVKVADQTLRDVNLAVNGSVGDAKYSDGNIATLPNSLAFDLTAKGDLKSGDLELTKLAAEVVNLLGATVSAKTKAWKEFSGDVDVTVNLSDAARQIPPSIAKKLPPLAMAGQATVKAAASGRAPTPDEIKSLKLPVHATVALGLNDFKAELPDMKLAVHLNEQLDVRYSADAVAVQSKLNILKLEKPDVLGDKALSATHQFELTLDHLASLRFRDAFEVPPLGLKNSVKADVDGLNPFIMRKLTGKPKEILENLRVSVATGFSLAADGKESLVKGVTLKGEVLGGLTVALEPKQQAAVQVNAGFKRLDVKYGELAAVTALDGALPSIGKTLSLTKAAEAKPAAAEDDLTARVETAGPTRLSSQRGLYGNVRPYSAYRRNLRIDEIQFAQHRVSNFALDLRFDDLAPQLDRFEMDVLGGSIIGSLATKLETERQSIHLALEFNLNPKKVLPFLQDVPDEEAEIAGDVEFAVTVGGEKGRKPGLEDIEAKVNITQIGAKALAALLVYLDPQESQPGIQAARKNLKLGQPTRVAMLIKNGDLSLDTWIKPVVGPEIKTPALQRISVLKVRGFDLVAQKLKVLEKVQALMPKLKATRLLVDEAGRIVLE